MTVTVSAQTVITAAAVLSAVALFITYFVKIIHWIDRDKMQDEKIKALEDGIAELKKERKNAVEQITAMHNSDIADIREEQQMLVYCSLACLKGLQQLGANGEVSKAIDTIEKHINKQAHR